MRVCDCCKTEAPDVICVVVKKIGSHKKRDRDVFVISMELCDDCLNRVNQNLDRFIRSREAFIEAWIPSAAAVEIARDVLDEAAEAGYTSLADAAERRIAEPIERAMIEGHHTCAGCGMGTSMDPCPNCGYSEPPGPYPDPADGDDDAKAERDFQEKTKKVIGVEEWRQRDEALDQEDSGPDNGQEND